MKRTFLLVWVIVASMGQLLAKDQMDLAFRQKECERLSKEFTQHAKELETRAKHLEGDAAKAATELSALKKKEAENLTELAEAIDKKQWSSIKRYEKKGQELCHEWMEKMESFEKKFGDRPHPQAKEEWKKKAEAASPEKVEVTTAKPEGKEPPKPQWNKEPKPEPVAEVKAEEPPSENPDAGLEKINAQAQGLGNP